MAAYPQMSREPGVGQGASPGLREPGYRPRHTGSRFSANARNPSIWSSLS